MLWWRNQFPVHHFSVYFHHTSSHRHHQKSARNVGSVCSYGTNSWHTIQCTPKLTSASISHSNKLLCLLQAGRSHVVMCNNFCKEMWMSVISSECPGMHWRISNCYCSSISIQGRNFDTLLSQILTHSITNFDTLYHKFWHTLITNFDTLYHKFWHTLSQIQSHVKIWQHKPKGCLTH